MHKRESEPFKRKFFKTPFSLLTVGLYNPTHPSHLNSHHKSVSWGRLSRGGGKGEVHVIKRHDIINYERTPYTK